MPPRSLIALAGLLAVGCAEPGGDPKEAPEAGTFVGQMTGQINGASFRADLVITVDTLLGVTGTWTGLDLHDTWRGEIRGRAFAGGFDCPGASSGFLCVSMTAPYVIATPAALFGELGPGGGGGRFEFQVYASGGDGGSGIQGEGTWRVE